MLIYKLITLDYPIVLLPKEIHDIQFLTPKLPQEPIKPCEPKVPVEPNKYVSSKDNDEPGCSLFIALGLIGLAIGGAIGFEKFGAQFYLITLGSLFFGCFGYFMFVINPKSQETNSYPSRMAQYINELQDYPKLKQEYDKDLRDYEKLKEDFDEQRQKKSSKEEILKYRINRLNAFFKIKNHNIELNKHEDYSISKGVSEAFFFNLLKEDFIGEIFINTKLLGYYPDFIFKDNEGRIINIEIDEPYVGYSGVPIHYLDEYHGHIDKKRDLHLCKNNIIVIRFAEEQIFKYPQKCIDFIYSVLLKIYVCNFSFEKPIHVPKIKCWTKEESNQMAFKRYRNSYVPKEFLKSLQVEGNFE